MPIPGTAANATNGKLYSFDISFVDQLTQTYYLADRSNAVVDVVDAKTLHLVKQIDGGFKGVALVGGVVQGGQSGPNGVAAAFPWLFVTDAASRVVSRTKVPLPFATNGAEQPVWDPGTSRFYLSIPQVNGGAGAVLRINPTTGVIETTYPIDSCGPAGLTLGRREKLLVGCNTVFDTAGNVWNPAGTVTAAPKDVILDIETGRTTDVPGAGAGDEIWYNAGDNKYYATGSGSPLRPTPASAAQGASVLAVIDARDQNLLQLVPTFNVPAVGTGNSSTQHPAGTAHSVAANAGNNYVFVPLGANNVFPDCLTGCIAVYFRPPKVE